MGKISHFLYKTQSTFIIILNSFLFFGILYFSILSLISYLSIICLEVVWCEGYFTDLYVLSSSGTSSCVEINNNNNNRNDINNNYNNNEVLA